jgi:serine protease
MTRSSWTALLVPLALLAASTAVAQQSGTSADGRYMVKFRDFNGAAQAVLAVGGQVIRELGPQRTIAAYLPEQALNGLRNNPQVEYVEVDPRRYLMSQTVPYGIPMVQATDSSLTTTSQNDVTVCIIDSGYYEAHEDLPKMSAGNITGNVTGTDVGGTGTWSQDSCGHGTHVAGTIAALNNAKGVLGVSGSDTLRLHIVKVFNGSDCKWTYASNLVSALNVCRNNVPASQRLVVSMSLGGTFSSTTENNAFQSAYDAGVLSVAAAGNDGNTRKSYPASYSSVISVAAVDQNGVHADFSQRNSEVELSAPGVGVLSTTPFKAAALTVGGNSYIGANIDGSARTDASGTFVDGGLCGTTGAWSGQIVLCERGTYSFAEKVANVNSGGGLGAVIYNNVPGGFAGTLNGTSTIPAISISQEDGQAARGSLGQTASLQNTAGTGNGYEYYDGTSMATPHVSGVAALVWSQNPAWSNVQIRDALQKTAKDLGAAGRDTSYGFGLVQAKAAVAYLNNGGGTPPPPSTAITLSVDKVKSKRSSYARLTWSGAIGSTVDYYRGTAKVTTPNDGTEDDGPLARGTYDYKVCNAGTQTCSSTVTVRF